MALKTMALVNTRRAVLAVLAVGCVCCGGKPGVMADAGAEAAGPVCGEPLPPDAESLSSDLGARIYAINQFFMGDTDTSGTPDANAWQRIGFDLDHTDTSNPQQQPNCSTQDTAFLLDGNCGIDNGLGSYFDSFPTISPLSQLQTSQATSGQWTLLLSVSGAAAGSSSTQLGGALYVGSPLTSPPRFDGSDVWPPMTDSAPGGQYANAWSDAYLVGASLFVTGRMLVPFDFSVGSGTRKRVVLQVELIEMDLSSDGASVTHGILAGIIPPASQSSFFGTCAGPATYYTDILSDGSVDPTRPCDATSFGIGFTAQAVTLGQPAAGLPAPPPCGGGAGG